MVERHVPQLEGQRFIAVFPGHGSAGPALGPIRKIEVFHGLRIHFLFDGSAQFVGQFPLLRNAVEDGGLPFFQLREPDPIVADGGHLQFVERAGALLAVAADKRNGRALFEEGDAMLHLPGGDTQLTGNVVGIQFIHRKRL